MAQDKFDALFKKVASRSPRRSLEELFCKRSIETETEGILLKGCYGFVSESFNRGFGYIKIVVCEGEATNAGIPAKRLRPINKLQRLPATRENFRYLRTFFCQKDLAANVQVEKGDIVTVDVRDDSPTPRAINIRKGILPKGAEKNG